MKTMAVKQRMTIMKKTPTITKEKIDEYTNKLSAFIVSGDWAELIPETHDLLQELVDSLTSYDVETVLSEIDHHLTYNHSDFVFRYTTDHLGPDADSKYTCTLEVGTRKRPYNITVVSRT